MSRSEVDASVGLLRDRVELAQLAHLYAWAVDGDPDVLDQLFTEGAVVDHSDVPHGLGRGERPVCTGRAAIHAGLGATPGDEPSNLFVTNHRLLRLAGDEAVTVQYVHDRNGAAGTCTVHATRTPAGWRIERLVVVGDESRGDRR